jgi:F-type H+-transporting ATPase subunit a
MADLDKHIPYALRQFESDILVPLYISGVDVSFTTASAAKVTTALLIASYLIIAMRERAIIPGRLQASAEIMYSFVADTVTKIAGPEGRPSIPFIFTICTFILFGTLLGMTPLHETFTSHLIVTFALALAVFAHVNMAGFRKHGWHFFRILLPEGVPRFVAPVFVIVETISYLARPVTLGFRIFANIFAGHVMLKLFADFCTMMVAALGTAGIATSIFAAAIMVVLIGFEIVIVCIQTYIFLLLSTMYLSDALHLHGPTPAATEGTVHE